MVYQHQQGQTFSMKHRLPGLLTTFQSRLNVFFQNFSKQQEALKCYKGMKVKVLREASGQSLCSRHVQSLRDFTSIPDMQHSRSRGCMPWWWQLKPRQLSQMLGIRAMKKNLSHTGLQLNSFVPNKTLWTFTASFGPA